jgi:hypothetical protein
MVGELLRFGSASLRSDSMAWHFRTLLHCVNDGLMAIFFFVGGLEIKRELLVGELASPCRAALPIAGVLGGAVSHTTDSFPGPFIIRYYRDASQGDRGL